MEKGPLKCQRLTRLSTAVFKRDRHLNQMNQALMLRPHYLQDLSSFSKVFKISLLFQFPTKILCSFLISLVSYKARCKTSLF
jgi:hypothetical protein